MSGLKIGKTGFLDLKSIKIELVVEEKELKGKGWLFNWWSKELAPVVVIRELAHKKELKVKPIELVEQSIRKVANNSLVISLEFDDFECIGEPTLSSVSLLQPNIEGKIYVKRNYVNKVIEEGCVALFDINTMINYDINLTVDEATEELYE